ncbi:MAG: ABC transporter substrate-binding protein [Streptosporangiales bacterium]
MHRRWHLAAAGLVASCLGLAACSTPAGTSGTGSGGGSGNAKVKDGGHLTVALAEAPDALDPTLGGTYVGRIVFINMCEKLYDINEHAEIVPELAAGMPKISKDGTSYTIPLRKGIKFNDGTAFNAKAVKTTLDRNMNNKRSERALSLAAVQKVSVVDPATVKLTLSHPYAPLTSILAARAGMILSPAQLAKLGDDFAKHPVCVGPFAFDSRPSSDKIELKKSTKYYDKDKVHLDGVTFKVVTQPSVRSANLRSGEINVSGRIGPADVASLKSSDSTKVTSSISLGYLDLTVNVSNTNGAGKPGEKPADNTLAAHPKLRKAFALSLDRETINKVVFNGLYKPGCTPISPASPFFTDVPCPEQDLTKAKQLVAESGVDKPVDVTLMIRSGDNLISKLGQVVQSMARKAGFDVHIEPVEFTTGLDRAQTGDFEIFQHKWSGRLDPDQNIAQFQLSSSSSNYSGAHDPRIDKLLTKGRTTTAQAERKKVYKALVQRILQTNTTIYLAHPRFVLGISGDVGGVKYYADNLIRLKQAGFTGS